jgi:N-acetyl-gamma-glutamyl-phosphate reductase
VSGYSGGGKSMIAEFEDAKASNYTHEVFRTYGLTLEHKHVGEMQKHSGLTHRPFYLRPSVGRFYRGMLVGDSASALGSAAPAEREASPFRPC